MHLVHPQAITPVAKKNENYNRVMCVELFWIWACHDLPPGRNSCHKCLPQAINSVVVIRWGSYLETNRGHSALSLQL